MRTALLFLCAFCAYPQTIGPPPGGGGGGGGTVTNIATSNGVTGGPITTTGTISGVNAAADGSTKGVAAFNATDFSCTAGVCDAKGLNGAAIPTTTNLAATNGSGQIVDSGKAAPTGAIVGTTDTQTLTNKTVDGVSPATFAFVDPTSSVQTQLNGKVPTTTTVAGHALSANVSIACADLTVPCITGNQTITLSGDTTGSGATAITTTTKQIHDNVTALTNASSPYAVVSTDSYISCDATAGAVVINLPATAGSGRELTVKKIDSSANACTPTRAGSDVIDGATTVSITSQYAAAKLLDRVAGTWDRIHVNQLVGDVTGSSTANVVKNINGTAFPTSATVIGSNGSAQPIAATTTGSGTTVVLSTSPTLVTPTLGVATATTINKVTLTAPATGSTLTIADGKTLTASNTLTFTGTDGSSVAFGAGGTVDYLGTAQTYTAAKTNSTNGAASTPAMLFSGTSFNGTGTTSFPMVMINNGGTAKTTWSTTGTYLGGNFPTANCNSTTGNIIDFAVDGTSEFKIGCNGMITNTGDFATGSGSQLSFGVNGNLRWTAASRFRIQNTNSIYVQTGTPTVASGFGGTPSVEAGSSDATMRVNVGTGGTATSGVINFAQSFPTAPMCIAVTEGSTVLGVATSTSTSQLTLTVATPWSASATVAVHCFGHT